MMELRRIQITRGGTFFVTLPKEWALRNGLTRGSIVATTETLDGRLLIDPKYNVERAPLVAVVKPGPHLNREIIGKYLLGYDIIRIEAKDRIGIEDREVVKKTSSRLIGLEIIEEDYSKIVMQCLLEPSALPPKKMLRREYSISSMMFKDSVTALVEGDVQLARNVVARDDEVDRLYFLLVRILRMIIQNPSLSERLKLSPIDCLDYRLTASLVESIGDSSKQIAEDAIQLGSKVEENISSMLLDFYKVVHESYSDSVTAFLSKNISIAESVRDRRDRIKELYHNLETAINTQPNGTAQILSSVISVINWIYEHAVDISDLTIPITYQKLTRR